MAARNEWISMIQPQLHHRAWSAVSDRGYNYAESAVSDRGYNYAERRDRNLIIPNRLLIFIY